ncbi:MAG: BREX system P-loop protein BrxC [candidate division NC10 bacterium]|nr:BREX system P-loop protein BrxC [candidate division NC10 bacterium]
MAARTIRELFAKPIDRRIEEVIKVDQADQATVEEEIREYVATASLKEHFVTVYRAVAEAPVEPHEGIGIWVSGFFGSGKSSFAKMLGYTLAARPLGKTTASALFKETVKDRRISDLLDSINRRIPIHAVIFDVAMDRGVRTASERITEIMYKALLRDLDYAEDFDLAELEIALEADGKLQEFEQRFQALYGKPWRVRRKLGVGVSEASRVLSEMDPATYPSPDSWARSLGEGGRADINPNTLAERAFDLMERRRPGHALVFVIDEVGQYVSRSVEKMLDLQALVQAFGVVGKNRVKARKAIAPCWIIVTSQEKLTEVVAAIDDKRVELARLQDRFPITIDLKQSDISEVTSRRVLEKNVSGRETLRAIYKENEGRLKALCTLERSARNAPMDETGFVTLYPYLPYQIDLCIDIVAGLRLKRGAQRHIGGSNRTIIKQAQQMLIHPRTNLAAEPPGALVTLDRVYELLYLGNLLPTEVTREVDEVPKRLPGNDLAWQVAKAIALLEAVKDLPRTPQNIAVTLWPVVATGSLAEPVQDALKVLEAAQFVRESEEGYKLLTVQEKTWETTRQGLAPKPADRNRIRRETIGEIFTDSKLRAHRYENLKNFKIGLRVDGEWVGEEGQIPLNILLAEDRDEGVERGKEARAISNEKRDELWWMAALTEEVHRLVEEGYRSNEMVVIHERLQAQGKLPAEQGASLAEEKIRRDRIGRELRTKLGDALRGGSGFFRGVQYDGSTLGATLPEALSALLDKAMPALYPKLRMGVRPLKGDEPEKVLTAANLAGLPPVFYHGENGLNLVVNQGGRYVPNPSAEVAHEVLEYLKREHAYGNKVTGKTLEIHFQGIGYGWDRDILRLVLAVLLRAGAIEVTHQGRRYRTHADPPAREPFTNNLAFRAASFAPREALSLKVLTDAVRHYEDLTGREVEIEEGAIAHALQEIAQRDRDGVRPLLATVQALGLPGQAWVAEYLETLDGILASPSDDCVRILAGEGKSLKEIRQRLTRLIEATAPENQALIRQARSALEAQWPVLSTREPGDQLREQIQKLSEALKSEEFYDHLETIRLSAEQVRAAYSHLYATRHEERAKALQSAVDSIRGLADWSAFSADPTVTDAERDALLSPLTSRACPIADLAEGTVACRTCHATVPQMESDLAAVHGLTEEVIRRLQQRTAPQQRVERVRLSAFLGPALTPRESLEEDLDEALARLREHILKLLAEGAKVIIE